MKNIRKTLAWIPRLCLAIACFYCTNSIVAQGYYVDKSGVIRDTKHKQEVSFWGVNYTTPFAHAYRMHKVLGVDLKQSIDKDVYHFARLGFNAYRIHIWDVEITDRKGNLLQNEHLDLLDYLIYQLKQRGIQSVLTLMAYWGNGYPEPNDPNAPGFSNLWNKAEVTRNDTAIAVSENYLKQFMEHVNPYTGTAYKDEHSIVGFEINNEPTNATEPKTTTRFVNRMVKAIRHTGCRAPIFYNMSHNFHNTQAFYDANIDGGTFQWYPSGLVAGHTRTNNFLPAVDTYPIPFEKIRHFNRKALIVYEFDAADVAAPYIYPAIARSFREAGMQWVTQFAYDPIEMAYANTEYQTHFLNLAYTPQKAISMKIAAEAMRILPRKTDFGVYPTDTLFGDFRVSFNERTSEMNSTTKFLYANNTRTQPKDSHALTEIAGYGTSPVVKYEGTGAYFLDKLAEGVWRLEVMPDAVWLEDPFAFPSLKRVAASVLWHEWPMTIVLPDLGDAYSYQAINTGNNRKGQARQGQMPMYPGVYLLKRQGVNTEWQANATWNNIKLNEYVAPKSKLTTCRVLHQPAQVITAGHPYVVTATVVGPALPDSVMLFLTGSRMMRARPMVMKRTSGYTYQVTLPQQMVAEGTLAYHIVVATNGQFVTYPSSFPGTPMDWDFYPTARYTVQVQSPDQGLELLNASADATGLETYQLIGFGLRAMEVSGSSPMDKRIRIAVPPMRGRSWQGTTPSAPREDQWIIREDIRDKVKDCPDRLSTARQIILRTGVVKGIDRIEVGFITSDGYTYRTECAISSDGTYQTAVDKLSERPTFIRPNAYPTFLPNEFNPVIPIPFDIRKIEFLEITTPKSLPTEGMMMEIKEVWIQ